MTLKEYTRAVGKALARDRRDLASMPAAVGALETISMGHQYGVWPGDCACQIVANHDEWARKFLGEGFAS